MVSPGGRTRPDLFSRRDDHAPPRLSFRHVRGRQTRSRTRQQVPGPWRRFCFASCASVSLFCATPTVSPTTRIPMRITRVLPFLFAALAIAACGSSSTTKPPDANLTPDAAPAINALGKLCDNTMPQMPCPTGNQCVVVTNVGSQTQCFCSPNCNGMNTICTAGYTGPAGGTEVCALGPTGGTPD